MSEKKVVEKWWVTARKEGRLCRLCGNPICKADWKDKILYQGRLETDAWADQETQADRAGENAMIFMWECPSCGYLISNEQYLLARADFGCPRCWKQISSFHQLVFQTKEDNAGKEVYLRKEDA